MREPVARAADRQRQAGGTTELDPEGLGHAASAGGAWIRVRLVRSNDPFRIVTFAGTGISDGSLDPGRASTPDAGETAPIDRAIRTTPRSRPRGRPP